MGLLEPTAPDSRAPAVASGQPWTRPGHFIRSLLQLGLAQVASWLAGAALTLLMPRYLGDVNLGKYSFAAATISLIALLATLGTSTLVTREIAKDRGQARALAVNGLLTRVPLSALAALAVLVFVAVGVRDPLTRTIFAVAAAGILFGSLSDMAVGILQGLQQIRVMAIYSSAAKILSGGIGVAVLLLGGRAVQLVEASILVAAVAVAVLLHLLNRRLDLRQRPSPRLMISLILSGLPFFIWQAALVVYGQIDVVMLSFMAGDAVVGWYSIAYRIVLIPGFFPVILMTVLFPALASAAADPPAFTRMAERALHYLVLLTVPMSLGIVLLADRIIDFAGYPPAFHNSVMPLLILSFHMPLVAIDMLIGTMLNALGRQRLWAMAGIAAAILNPLANLVAIPWAGSATGNQGIGAAVVVVLTEGFLLIVGLRMLPVGIFSSQTLRGVIRSLIAAALMGVMVWLFRGAPVPIAITLGGVSFAIAALLTGALHLDDLREIRAAIAGRRELYG